TWVVLSWSRLRHLRLWQLGLVLLGFASALGVVGTIESSGEPPALKAPANVPREGRPGGYLSSDKCRFCHPSQYQSCYQSYHRRMTQYASPEAVSAPFDGVELRSADTFGESYHLARLGDEFWVDMVDPDWQAGFEKQHLSPQSVVATEKPWVRKRVT